MFLDSVCLLNPNVSSELDVINTNDVEVLDECLAEYCTSLRTSPGVLISGLRVRAQDRIIELFEHPTIVNVSSHFVYTPSPYVFALAQAHLPRLPSSLEALVSGLFDGIPAPRQPLDAHNPRTDVVITGRRAPRPIAGSGAGSGARAPSGPPSASSCKSNTLTAWAPLAFRRRLRQTTPTQVPWCPGPRIPPRPAPR